jgi:hypothetical protein
MRAVYRFVLTVLVAVLLPATATRADIDGTTDSSSGEVTVRASTAPVYGSGGGGSGGPVCRWQAMTRGQAADIGGGGGSGALTLDERRQTAVRTIGGRVHILYIVGCGSTTTLRYVHTGITAGDLLPGVLDIARGRIQPPTPDINPPASAGGIVNLGLWLAVEPATTAPISAEAGPAWITVTPEHTETTFDFGNGDTITCDGPGTPITDLETVDQGPCGYTYVESSPDDEPYQLTISTTWALPYTSSDGPGTLPPLTRDLSIDYDVDEIQTIGIDG